MPSRCSTSVPTGFIIDRVPGRGVRAAGSTLASLDADQLDVERQGRVARDRRRVPQFAVAHRRRNRQTPAFTDTHARNPLFPAGNDLVAGDFQAPRLVLFVFLAM